MNSPIKTQKALTPQDIDEILRGIRRGRSLKQIEDALGVDTGAFLELKERDESINIRYKSSLAISAWAIDSQLTELLRKNYEEPESAVKNNALKLLMDHAHKQMDARDPAVFSGKAPVNISVPIQIVTSLDLGQQKSLEGVYELKAEHISDAKTADLQIESGLAAGNEPGGASGSRELDTPKAETPTEAGISAFKARRTTFRRRKEVAEGAVAAKCKSKAVEKAPSRPKSGRKRSVVRQEQALVEQSEGAAQL